MSDTSIILLRAIKQAVVAMVMAIATPGPGWAESEQHEFELSGIYRSSYPAVLYKRAFEEDLNFPERSCFQAMNGEILVTAFSSISIARQCENNLVRLSEIRRFAFDYIDSACVRELEAKRYFTEESTASLCEGYLMEILLVEVERSYTSFGNFRTNLLEFAEKCRRRTGDADGC
jgi:hypothetical protein